RPVCDTPGANPLRLDGSRDRDDLVPPHDERPRLALRSRNLGVDEHVLDLLRAPGEPVARAPGPYLKSFLLGGDAPPSPVDLAFERDRRPLQPEPAVLADGGPPRPRLRRLGPHLGSGRPERPGRLVSLNR